MGIREDSAGLAAVGIGEDDMLWGSGRTACDI